MRKLIAFISLASAAAAIAQQGPAVRPLGPVQAVSTESFGTNVFVRHLKGGSVLVNDVFGRRVVRLDDKLGLAEVVADSTPATANAYSGRSGSLVAYKGDSSLFIDATTQLLELELHLEQRTHDELQLPPFGLR